MVAVWLAVALGTLVTGAGPHSGDPDTGRNGFDEELISQLHADVVFALLGVSIALVIATRVTATSRTLRKLAAWLLAMELLQGVVGFTQYFTGLPWVLVLIHMFFAALLIALSPPCTANAAHPLPENSTRRTESGVRSGETAGRPGLFGRLYFTRYDRSWTEDRRRDEQVTPSGPRGATGQARSLPRATLLARPAVVPLVGPLHDQRSDAVG